MPVRRIVITLSGEEFEFVLQESRRQGFLPSTFAKYKVLQGLLPCDSASLPDLLREMQAKLDALDSGATFIVASLFEPSRWRSLDRTTKNSLAQALRRIVRDSPGKFVRTEETMPDKTRIYQKL